MSWYSKSVKPIEEYTSAVIAGIFRSISVGAALALVLLLAGCGGSGFKWEGEWQGNHNFKVENGENPYLIRTMGQVTLKMERTTFKLVEAGINYEGSVRYADEKAYLKVESRMDRDMSKEPPEVQNQFKEIVLTPRQDGKIDFYDPGGMVPKPVTLERQEAK